MDFENYYSDAQLDEIYADDDTAANSFKALLPLLVYQILKKYHGNVAHVITQTALLEKIKRVYDVNLDRRALSRTLHAMNIYGKGVVITKKGVYYDAQLDDIAA